MSRGGEPIACSVTDNCSACCTAAQLCGNFVTVGRSIATLCGLAQAMQTDLTHELDGENTARTIVLRLVDGTEDCRARVHADAPLMLGGVFIGTVAAQHIWLGPLGNHAHAAPWWRFG